MAKKKFKNVAGMVKVSRMSTFDLLAYLDITGRVQADMANTTNHILENQKYGGIAAKDSRILLDELQANRTQYAKAQETISKVLNSRFKRDIGINNDMNQVMNMITGYAKKHPILETDMNQLELKWRDREDKRIEKEESDKLKATQKAEMEIQK